MRRAAALIALAVAAQLCAGADARPSPGAEAPADRHAQIAMAVGEMLKSLHVTRHAPDDEISRRAFTNLLEACDADHAVFSAEDVAEFSKSIDSLDDMFAKGDFSFAIAVRERYGRRLAERVAFATNLLARAKFSFDGGSYVQDRRDAPWPKSGEEMDAVWSARVENQVLDALVSCQTGKVEAAAASVSRMYIDMLSTESRRKSETAIDDFIGAVASAYDSHTTYMTPAMFAMFSSQMSLSVCGIGVQWAMKDGSMKVVRVLPGGSAAKDGRIRAGDRIVGVASKGTNETVRVAGMKELDLISLFQGRSGEPLTLEVEHADGRSGRYTLTRSVLEIEDEAATSKVVEATVGGKRVKLGYLRLPSFYASAPAKSGGGFRSSSEDVRAELRKLRDAGAEGVLFDLRGNPGGSLDDAVKVISLFVRGGPGVRMKGLAGEVTLATIEDYVECETPMVVLTSHTSASAGELVPATLQDYGRAVIVGDEHTFGKGTDQVVGELNSIAMLAAATSSTSFAESAAAAAAIAEKAGELGALAVTEGRFYRITGGSTQLRGVAADVVTPSILYDDKGESGLKYPLPWNTIDSIPFERGWDLDRFVPELRAASEARRAKSATWRRHEGFVRRSQELVKRRAVPLDLKLRRAQKESDEAMYDEMNRLDTEGFNPEKREADAVLDEGLSILADLVRLNGGRRLPPLKTKRAAAAGIFDGLDADD